MDNIVIIQQKLYSKHFLKGNKGCESWRKYRNSCLLAYYILPVFKANVFGLKLCIMRSSLIKIMTTFDEATMHQEKLKFCRMLYSFPIKIKLKTKCLSNQNKWGNLLSQLIRQAHPILKLSTHYEIPTFAIFNF